MKKGLMLIELLLIAASIGILSALLLPIMLSNRKAQAKEQISLLTPEEKEIFLKKEHRVEYLFTVEGMKVYSFYYSGRSRCFSICEHCGKKTILEKD